MEDRRNIEREREREEIKSKENKTHSGFTSISFFHLFPFFPPIIIHFLCLILLSVHFLDSLALSLSFSIFPTPSLQLFRSSNTHHQHHYFSFLSIISREKKKKKGEDVVIELTLGEKWKKYNSCWSLTDLLSSFSLLLFFFSFSSSLSSLSFLITHQMDIKINWWQKNTKQTWCM